MYFDKNLVIKLSLHAIKIVFENTLVNDKITEFLLKLLFHITYFI